MVSASVVAPQANLELESHPNILQASSSYAGQQHMYFLWVICMSSRSSWSSPICHVPPPLTRRHMRRLRSNTASTQNVHNTIVAAPTKVDHMFPQQEICAVHDVFLFCRTCRCNHWDNVHRHHWRLPCPLFLKHAVHIFGICLWPQCYYCLNHALRHIWLHVVTAFNEVISTLKAGGYTLALNVMDNECSAAVEIYIRFQKRLASNLSHRTTIVSMPLTCDCNIQGILHCSLGNCWYALPASTLGWISTTGWAHPEHAMFLTPWSQEVSQTGSIWNFQFQ